MQILPWLIASVLMATVVYQRVLSLRRKTVSDEWRAIRKRAVELHGDPKMIWNDQEIELRVDRLNQILTELTCKENVQ